LNLEQWTPISRDLSPKRLEARKEHLLAEISRENRSPLAFPHLNWTPIRLSALVGLGAASAVALAFALTTNSSPNSSIVVHAPLYTFHAPSKSLMRGRGHHETETSVADSYVGAAAHSAGFSGSPANALALASRLTVFDSAAHPLSGVWFNTTRQLAVASQSVRRVEAPHTRVFFVVIHGTFVARKPLFADQRQTGNATSAPRGTILTFTIGSKSGDILDISIGNSRPDEEGLGRAHPLIFARHRRTR